MTGGGIGYDIGSGREGERAEGRGGDARVGEGIVDRVGKVE